MIWINYSFWCIKLRQLIPLEEFYHAIMCTEPTKTTKTTEIASVAFLLLLMLNFWLNI